MQLLNVLVVRGLHLRHVDCRLRRAKCRQRAALSALSLGTRERERERAMLTFFPLISFEASYIMSIQGLCVRNMATVMKAMACSAVSVLAINRTADG